VCDAAGSAAEIEHIHSARQGGVDYLGFTGRGQQGVDLYWTTVCRYVGHSFSIRTQRPHDVLLLLL
jgi:hypothetical protein